MLVTLTIQPPAQQKQIYGSEENVYRSFTMCKALITSMINQLKCVFFHRSSIRSLYSRSNFHRFGRTSTLRRDTWQVNQIIVLKRFWQSLKPFLTLSEWFPNLRLLCLKVIVEIISNGFLMRWMNFVLIPYCFSISSITPVTVSCGMFRNIPDVNQAVLSPITLDVVEKGKIIIIIITFSFNLEKENELN